MIVCVKYLYIECRIFQHFFGLVSIKFVKLWTSRNKPYLFLSVIFL